VNPFGTTLLGPLPPVPLTMFDQIIFPIVGWLRRRQRFTPNREVSRIIPLALGDLFNPAHYRCLRVQSERRGDTFKQDFICFIPPHCPSAVPLWGATLRMVFGFMKAVFDFRPPPAASLPVIPGLLPRTYTTGGRRSQQRRKGLSIKR